MKIVQVHNYYKIAGGEDTVVAQEKKMLENNGHNVVTYYKRNDVIDDFSFLDKVKLLQNTQWSKETYHSFLKFLEQEKPEICHVHNVLPLISPSIYEACKKNGVPVVQTLHNYRLICTNGLLMREEKICEDCLSRSAYGAVLKKCYRNSYLQTYAVARMIEKNKARKVWTEKVDAYICLTEFAKQKFIEHGLPVEKLTVKPNFIEELTISAVEKKEPYFIFVGRITASKGVELLKKIDKELPIPLKMVGEGDLENQFINCENITLLGKKSHAETLKLIQGATALIIPSLWYEGMPMTILEAFSLKTPVIASNIGAMKTMINHELNGLLFEPNKISELKENLSFAISKQPILEKIALNAFTEFQNEYSAASNYKKLMKIYSELIKR